MPSPPIDKSTKKLQHTLINSVALLDVEFQAEWIAREEQHKKALETEKQQQERLAEYRKEYNNAWFDGDYAHSYAMPKKHS